MSGVSVLWDRDWERRCECVCEVHLGWGPCAHPWYAPGADAIFLGGGGVWWQLAKQSTCSSCLLWAVDSCPSQWPALPFTAAPVHPRVDLLNDQWAGAGRTAGILGWSGELGEGCRALGWRVM